MKLIIAICSGLLSAAIVTTDYGTTKQHHDTFKALFGNVDDAVVALGLIDDVTLHKIGASLDLCETLGGTHE